MAGSPRGHGTARRSGATIHYAISFNFVTFTFLIKLPAARVTGFTAPRGFGCGVDPDGALRCVARRALAAGHTVRGNLTTRPLLRSGRRLQLIGFGRRGPIGPFPIRLSQ